MPNTANYGPMTMDPYAADEQSIERQRQIAQALMARGMKQDYGSTPMVGNMAVRRSPLEGLAGMLQVWNANQMMTRADERKKAIQQQRMGDFQSDMQSVSQAAQGTPEIPVPSEEAGGGPGRPAMPGSKQAMIAAMLSGRSPQIQQMGMQYQMRDLFPEPVVVGRSLLDKNSGKIIGQDATWQSEQEAGRLAASEARKEKAEEQRRRDAEAFENRKALMGIAAGMKQPPAPHPVTIVDPEGRQVVIDARTGQKYGLSPGDVKLQGAFNQDTAALQGATNAMDRLGQAANDAMQHPGLKGITGLRGAIPNIPGTNAADAQAKLNTLKSQVAFGVLQEMRNNSKTGGALGSVSDAEGKRLEANLAALENAQSYEQMRESLGKIIEYTEGAKQRLRNAYNMKHGDKAQGVQISDPGSSGGWSIKRVQ